MYIDILFLFFIDPSRKGDDRSQSQVNLQFHSRRDCSSLSCFNVSFWKFVMLGMRIGMMCSHRGGGVAPGGNGGWNCQKCCCPPWWLDSFSSLAETRTRELIVTVSGMDPMLNRLIRSVYDLFQWLSYRCRCNNRWVSIASLSCARRMYIIIHISTGFINMVSKWLHDPVCLHS